jgi:hypothetical protein
MGLSHDRLRKRLLAAPGNASIALPAVAPDAPGGGGGGPTDPNPGATTDVAQVNSANDYWVVNDANDKGQAGA